MSGIKLKGWELTQAESQRSEGNCSHLVNLLSIKDVKEGFYRKPTTIVLMGWEMRGETRRHTELSKLRAKTLRDALYRGKSMGVELVI